MIHTPEWKVTGGSAEYWNVAESVDVPPDWAKALMDPGDIAMRPVCRVKKSAGAHILARILAVNDLIAALTRCHDWILSQQTPEKVAAGQGDGEAVRLEARAALAKAGVIK